MALYTGYINRKIVYLNYFIFYIYLFIYLFMYLFIFTYPYTVNTRKYNIKGTQIMYIGPIKSHNVLDETVNLHPADTLCFMGIK